MDDLRMRSGRLTSSNDELIYEMLGDENYDVREDGTIWTLIAQTGKRSTKGVWRKAGKKPVIGNKKINLTIARLIRELSKRGHSYKMIMKEYALSKSTISYIINNKIWTEEIHG
jgi:hypothetical protein